MVDLEKLDASIAAQLGKSIELNSQLRARIEALEAALRAVAPTETHCDVCGKAFKPDDDVVLMGSRGNFHQACYLKDKTAARIEALEAALRMIADKSYPEPATTVAWAQAVAAAALAPKGEV